MTPAASLAFRLAAGSHMARQKELESPTFRLGGGRSIQLSYWRIFNFKGDRPSGGERSWFS